MCRVVHSALPVLEGTSVRVSQELHFRTCPEGCDGLDHLFVYAIQMQYVDEDSVSRLKVGKRG